PPPSTLSLHDALPIFCSRTMLSRLTRSRGRILSFTSALLESSSRKYPTLCSRRLLWLTPVDRRSDSSSAPSGAPAGVGSAGFGRSEEHTSELQSRSDL